MARWLLFGLLISTNAWGFQAARQRRPVPPQTKPATRAPAAWPVESVTIEGNRLYSREQLLPVIGLKPGQLAGKQDFEAARERLLATGAFDSVGYRFSPAPGGKGYAASFQVAEITAVYPYRFEDLNTPDAELERQLRDRIPLHGPSIPATTEVLDRYAKVIEEVVNRTGGKTAVAGRLAADAPGKLVIVFRPAGPRPSVAEVRFTGNRVLPTETLRTAIAGAGIGVPYSEPSFRQILEANIRPLYEERGRIRVAFPRIQTAPAQGVSGLVLTVEIAEGESYNLGKVGFAGEDLPVEELRKAGDFATGDVANFQAVEAGLERIRKRLRREGYLGVETSVERKVNEQAKTVDLTVHVAKGPQYVFGKLFIEGLDLHGEAAVRRMWALKEGAPFNADYPDYFLERVREGGVFDNLGKTRSAVKRDDRNHTADVTLSFLR